MTDPETSQRMVRLVNEAASVGKAAGYSGADIDDVIHLASVMSAWEPEIRVSLTGNDEGDVHCDVCGRSDWYQALRFVRTNEDGGTTRTTMCLRRYEGLSCGDLAKSALFQTNIPGGTFPERSL